MTKSNSKKLKRLPFYLTARFWLSVLGLGAITSLELTGHQSTEIYSLITLLIGGNAASLWGSRNDQSDNIPE